MDLIRRYARTLRVLHAEAMTARGPRIGARERRAGEAGERLASAEPTGGEEGGPGESSTTPAG